MSFLEGSDKPSAKPVTEMLGESLGGRWKYVRKPSKVWVDVESDPRRSIYGERQCGCQGRCLHQRAFYMRVDGDADLRMVSFEYDRVVVA